MKTRCQVCHPGAERRISSANARRLFFAMRMVVHICAVRESPQCQLSKNTNAPTQNGLCGFLTDQRGAQRSREWNVGRSASPQSRPSFQSAAGCSSLFTPGKLQSDERHGGHAVVAPSHPESYNPGPMWAIEQRVVAPSLTPESYNRTAAWRKFVARTIGQSSFGRRSL